MHYYEMYAHEVYPHEMRILEMHAGMVLEKPPRSHLTNGGPVVDLSRFELQKYEFWLRN